MNPAGLPWEPRRRVAWTSVQISGAVLAAMLYLQGDGRGQRGVFPEFDLLHSGEVFLGHLERSRGQDLVQSQGEEFLRGEPGQLADCGAGIGNSLIQIHIPDDIPGIVGQEPVLCFTLLQGLFHPHPLSDFNLQTLVDFRQLGAARLAVPGHCLPASGPYPGS